MAMACALALAACAPAGGAGEAAEADSAAAGDTLRGTVEVVGSEPATSVVLRTADGRVVALDGARPLLDRAAGLEVRVDGTATPRAFHVARMIVRAANGIPAVDGLLARTDDGWFLETATGETVAIAHLPEPFRGMEGARVWLAGPLDRPADSYGVLVPPS